jgi:hypothetical protein
MYFGRSLSVSPPPSPRNLLLLQRTTTLLAVFLLTSLHFLLAQPEPVLPPINLFFKDDPFKGHIFHAFLLTAIRSLRAPYSVFLPTYFQVKLTRIH